MCRSVGERCGRVCGGRLGEMYGVCVLEEEVLLGEVCPGKCVGVWWR